MALEKTDYCCSSAVIGTLGGTFFHRMWVPMYCVWQPSFDVLLQIGQVWQGKVPQTNSLNGEVSQADAVSIFFLGMGTYLPNTCAQKNWRTLVDIFFSIAEKVSEQDPKRFLLIHQKLYEVNLKFFFRLEWPLHTLSQPPQFGIFKSDWMQGAAGQSLAHVTWFFPNFCVWHVITPWRG